MSVQALLKEAYLLEQPVDTARCLESIETKDLPVLLLGINPLALIEVLDALPSRRAVETFAVLGKEQQATILREASPRLALEILTGLEPQAQEELLAGLPAAIAADLKRLGQFDEDSAGRLMDRPYGTIRLTMSVGQTLELLRRSGAKRVRSVYVVDSKHHLQGRVDVQAMAMADNEQTMKELLEPIEATVLATAPRHEVVDLLERHHVDSLPVVDVEGRLLGVVRYHTLFEAVEAVATATMQKMVGASEDERALSVPLFAVKRRLPWLHINLLTAFLAASVVGAFESLIAQFTALAVLLPVVAGQSGNAGSQALAVTMRGLALREIGTRAWRKVLWKELRVGLIDGVVLAVTCGLAVFLWSQSLGLTFVIGVAMILSVVAAGAAGAIVPMVLIRVGQDPATASSIILTTVTDVAGFVSFLGTAALLSFML